MEINDATLYAELCDLFYQAVEMGKMLRFKDEVNLDPHRVLNSSPQARMFATAAQKLLKLDLAHFLFTAEVVNDDDEVVRTWEFFAPSMSLASAIAYGSLSQGELIAVEGHMARVRVREGS